MTCRICGKDLKRRGYIYGACNRCTRRAIIEAEARAARCLHCGSEAAHYLHEPVASCTGCLAPTDHHDFERSGERYQNY